MGCLNIWIHYILLHWQSSGKAFFTYVGTVSYKESWISLGSGLSITHLIKHFFTTSPKNSHSQRDFVKDSYLTELCWHWASTQVKLRMLVQEALKKVVKSNWEHTEKKWQNRILFIIAGNGLQWPKSDSYTYSEYLITMKLAECRNEDSVAEIDTNSIFKILWLDHLLALASSIV